MRWLTVVLLALCSLSSASVTVRAKLTDGTGTISKTGFLRFQLQNCGPNIPADPTLGSAPIQTQFDLRPNQPDGSILYTNLISNDELLCGGVASTYWLVTPMKDQTHPLRDGLPFFLHNGDTFDPSTAQPMAHVPPAPPQSPLCCVSPLVQGSGGNSNGGGNVQVSCNSPNANLYWFNGIFCDPFFLDDGFGNWQAISGTLVGPQGGWLQFLPGPSLVSPPALGWQFTIQPGMTAGVQAQLPNVLGGINQAICVLASDGVSTEVLGYCNAGAGAEFQVNGLDLANCTAGVCPLLNLVAGTGITLSNTSSGNVQISASGTSQIIQLNGTPLTTESPANIINSAITPTGMQFSVTNPSAGNIQTALNDGTTHALNPGLPQATVNGTPGTTDDKYGAIGCEDINCTYHSAISSIVDVTNAPATITSVNSITLSGYADTLYGYRFYIICRTSASGTPASTGKIATGVGKAFIDTGLSGDGSNCASLYANNTTVLSPIPCLSSFSPGGPSMPGAPCGIDAPPLSPLAINDEFSEQFGSAGDANDAVWTRVNAGSATYTWTGGTLSIAASGSGGDSLHCVFHAAPSTPYGIVAPVYYNTTRTGNVLALLALRESSTGKIVTVGAQIQTAGNSALFLYARWTSPTANSVYTATTAAMSNTQPFYLKVGSDGTNTEYQYSPNGLVYQTITTEAKNAFFTTAPDQVGICADTFAGTSSVETDYIRQVSF